MNGFAAPTKIVSSPSHQRYLDSGCEMTREVPGRPIWGGTAKMIHFYGPCADCGVEMQDVDDRGFEECSLSPYTNSYYGDPDHTICTSCAGKRYRAASDLTGRMAKCHYKSGRDGKAHANGPVASSFSLAFFEYKPDQEFDTYYCGCWGWD
jgi:hypothetical protein